MKKLKYKEFITAKELTEWANLRLFKEDVLTITVEIYDNMLYLKLWYWEV